MKITPFLLFWLLFPLATFAQLKVMPLGDSITQGDPINGTYRKALWNMLQANGASVDFVGSHNSHHDSSPCGALPGETFDQDNEGHWGWKADEILNGNGQTSTCKNPYSGGLSDWLLVDTPDMVLIHLGTNDMFQDETVSSTIAELGAVIDTLRVYNPNVIVLLAQVIPTGYFNDNQNMIKLNAEIPNLASQKHTANSPVEVVDHFTGYDGSQDNHDQVHPNNSGQDKMANKWYAAMSSYLTIGSFPVTWVSMSAQAARQQIELTWATAQEVNNRGFAVELRPEGQADFESVGFVEGAGHRQELTQYTFTTDRLAAGQYEVRLQQRDFDGHTTYSSVKRVRIMSQVGTGLLLSPNPAHDHVSIELPAACSEGPLILRLFDARGHCLAQRQLSSAATPRPLRVGALPVGLYTAELSDQTGRRWLGRVVISR